MNKSWKTTLFGLLAAVGAGTVAAITTGTIDPTHISPWFKDLAVLLSIIGTAGLGVCARDNNKSSEQVGAGPNATSGAPRTTIPLLMCIASLSLAGLVWAGCAATPARVAYNTMAAPAIGVDQVMTAWGDYVEQYHPSAATELKVKAAFERYQKAELLAIDAAQAYAELAASGATNALGARLQTELTSQTAANALADLVSLLQTLDVKL